MDGVRLYRRAFGILYPPILLADWVMNTSCNCGQFAQLARCVFNSAAANAAKNREQALFQMDGKAKVSNGRIDCGMETGFHVESSVSRRRTAPNQARSSGPSSLKSLQWL